MTMTKEQFEAVLCSIHANEPFLTVPSRTAVISYLEDHQIDWTEEDVQAVLNSYKWQK